MLTQVRLIELFEYNLETGWFTNRASRGRAKAGERAGSSSGHVQGYRRLTIDYERVYEHQAAWLYVYGEWLDEIDHEDTDGSFNAILNLRQCTRTQNCCNSQRQTGRSGLRGAYLDSRDLKWFSKIQFGDVVTYLGLFDTAEEAHEAFEAAAKQLHGEFYSPPPRKPMKEKPLWRRL
jgi:hypothetical protein